MALKYLIPIDLNNNEIRNIIVHLLGTDPGSPPEGQLWYDTSNHLLKFRNNAATIQLGRLDQISAPTADVSLNSHKLTNVTDPGSPQDAATKNYVDGVATGSVYWKNPVRVLATTNQNIGSAPASIDGVTLASGDRVALTGQTTASANGIYIYNGSGAAMTRSSDADTSAEVRSGMAFWVNEGTANADTAWTLTTNDPITLDTTALTFVQFSGLGQITAGAGLTKTGNTLDVVGTTNRISVAADSIDIAATYVGQTSITTVGTIGTGTWQGTAVAVGFGGTGANTAAGARSNLGATGKYSALIGDGSSTTINITQATHGLSANNQLIAIAQQSTGEQVICDITYGSSGTVSFIFAVAPASNSIRIVIMG